MLNKFILLFLLSTLLTSMSYAKDYSKQYDKGKCNDGQKKYKLLDEKEYTLLRKKDYKSASRYAKKKYRVLKETVRACEDSSDYTSYTIITLRSLEKKARENLEAYEDAGYL